MERMNESVAAVVVTNNRKQLLSQCLGGILAQTLPVQGIVLVDNASSDGTPGMLKDLGLLKEVRSGMTAAAIDCTPEIAGCNNSSLNFHYFRSAVNVGSSGGFHEGVKRAYEKGYDWYWLMDDDVVPREDCLEELLSALKILRDRDKPRKVGFLSSNVLGINGNIMNTPAIEDKRRMSGYQDWNRFLDHGMVALNSATFVSLFVSRCAVEKVGYPLKEMFIWGDDDEFTLRISSTGLGCYLVGRSEVTHKRGLQAPLSIFHDSPDRIANYFYSYRNQMHNMRKYHSRKELAVYLLYVSRDVVRLSLRPGRLAILLKGMISGMFFNPTIERPL